MLRMKQIGIIIERQRAYGRNLCEGIVRFARERSDWSLNMFSFEDLRQARELRRCDGFIARVINDEIGDTLLGIGKPVVDVYVNRVRGEFASADQNADRIGELAVRHFLEHRFTRFAFFGHESHRYSDLRRDAFRRCLAAEGLDCEVYQPPKSIKFDFDRTVIYREQYRIGAEGRHILRWISRLEKPVAVFCSHDLRAYQLCAICREAGIAVPSEIAILGVDNDSLLCNFTEPTLSSIDPNAEGIGYAAAERLAGLFDGEAPRPSFIMPKGLVERGSTLAYPVNPPWLSDALVFIRANVANQLQARDVFERTGRSHTVVDRVFREVLGDTVARTIANSRIDEAKRLLGSSDLTLAEIAKLSGFASVQYFTNAFTEAVGQSPSVYRKTN